MLDNPESRLGLEPPWMFTKIGLGLLAAVAVGALTLSSVEISLLAITLLIVGLVARGWERLAPRALTYRRVLSTMRTFAGEAVTLETTLSNLKPLPLPWVEVWERLPKALQPPGLVEASPVREDFVWMSQGAALWPFQRARWKHQLQCDRRGVYPLSMAYVRTGDPFSLHERDTRVPGESEVLVYPKVVHLERFALPVRHPSIDTVAARSLVPDPTRTATLRDYQAGDSPRLIHWPTTARRGTLQVRVLEPATSLHVCLMLDVRGFMSIMTPQGSHVELALSALASIAMYLQRQGYPTGFYCNSDPGITVAPGSTPGHLQSLLDAMARFELGRSQALSAWALEHLPRGATVVLAASEIAPNLALNMARLRAAGYQVALLLVESGEEDEALPFMGEFARIRPDSDLRAVLESQQ